MNPHPYRPAVSSSPSHPSQQTNKTNPSHNNQVNNSISNSIVDPRTQKHHEQNVPAHIKQYSLEEYDAVCSALEEWYAVRNVFDIDWAAIATIIREKGVVNIDATKCQNIWNVISGRNNKRKHDEVEDNVVYMDPLSGLDCLLHFQEYEEYVNCETVRAMKLMNPESLTANKFVAPILLAENTCVEGREVPYTSSLACKITSPIIPENFKPRTVFIKQPADYSKVTKPPLPLPASRPPHTSTSNKKAAVNTQKPLVSMVKREPPPSSAPPSNDKKQTNKPPIEYKQAGNPQLNPPAIPIPNNMRPPAKTMQQPVVVPVPIQPVVGPNKLLENRITTSKTSVEEAIAKFMAANAAGAPKGPVVKALSGTALAQLYAQRTSIKPSILPKQPINKPPTTQLLSVNLSLNHPHIPNHQTVQSLENRGGKNAINQPTPNLTNQQLASNLGRSVNNRVNGVSNVVRINGPGVLANLANAGVVAKQQSPANAIVSNNYQHLLSTSIDASTIPRTNNNVSNTSVNGRPNSESNGFANLQLQMYLNKSNHNNKGN